MLVSASRAGSDSGDGGGSSVLTRVVSQLLTELDGIVALQVRGWERRGSLYL